MQGATTPGSLRTRGCWVPMSVCAPRVLAPPQCHARLPLCLPGLSTTTGRASCASCCPGPSTRPAFSCRKTSTMTCTRRKVGWCHGWARGHHRPGIGHAAQGSPRSTCPGSARRSSDVVPGSAQTTCGTASWPTAPATAAHGPPQRRVCAASTGKPQHPMTTGAPVSPAAPGRPPVALGSMGQRGMGWGQLGGNGDSLGAIGTAWGQ